ncbi:MAG TPA: DUF255 domain-containing protein [Thermoanaerobaculia bacterium]|jgi:uncharacterized protein YyaL (SSP411 family)|nr:DUF255 domain-containing protein [Thermoanaerobaculia bacterium]
MRRVLALTAILVCALSARGASRYFTDREGAPVRWQRWGSAAFERAAKEKRPIFLSIGFHASWECYRMHREAFLNGENAEALNAYFVPVLLDRIEHPEIAERYESDAKAMSGVTGWPVQLVLTPKLEPIAAAGFLTSEELNRLLVQQANVWAAGKYAPFRAPETARPAAAPDVESVADGIAKTYDAKNGGFGIAPKRPRPMTISFLLRYAARTKQEGIRSAAIDTLKKMAVAPVRDQLGGGFHRATRDAEWREPYFEKMLSDQALLAMAYLEASQATNDAELAYVARATLDFSVRDMHDPAINKGTFDSSQAAYNFVPVQGPELLNGNFYRWQKDEIARLLPREVAAKVFTIYAMTDDVANLPALAEWRFMPETHEQLAAPLAKLLDVRRKRPQPPRDFTPVAGLNGLAISALARGGAASGEKTYIEVATSAATNLIATHWNPKTKTLLRAEGIDALSEDYALLVQGLLDLFDASFDVRWLELAVTLQQRHDALFWDAAAGAYAKGTFREIDDEMPAASSVAALNLLRLAALTGNETWRSRPQTIFEAFGGRMRASGADYAQMASAWELAQLAPSVVVVSGEWRLQATQELLQSHARKPAPMRALVFVPDKGAPRDRVVRAMPWLAPLAAGEKGAPVAYVCANGECEKQ